MKASDKLNLNYRGDIFGHDTGITINEDDRLVFAKQITLGLAIMSSAIMAGYACYPDNRALSALIEIIKVGILPMATLVISFYFTSSARK